MSGCVQLSMDLCPRRPLAAPSLPALKAEDFTNAIEDAAPYYSIRYPDMRRRQKGKHEASYFIVYRRSDGEAVHESATYDEFTTTDRAAADVVSDFLENGESSQ